MQSQHVDSPAHMAIVCLPLRHPRHQGAVERLPDLDRALVNPASVFLCPHDVVRHPVLTLNCKREILSRWAWDEYLLDLALADGMPEGEPSRLSEVKAALRILNVNWSPDPAAPAMAIPRLDQHGVLWAA